MPNETLSGTTFKYNLRFAGQYYDEETGLNYNVNRDYNPNWGRYIQSDPLGLVAGINTYGYVGANSLSGIDPEGLAGEFLNNSVNFGAGFGDLVSFGLTGVARDLGGIGNVNSCSGYYTAGEVVGFFTGVGSAWKLGTKANAIKISGPVNWQNFSHSLVPNRVLKRIVKAKVPYKSASAKWLNKRGNRLNGDYVTPGMHGSIDSVARIGNMNIFPDFIKLGLSRQLINRMPYVPGAVIYGVG